jgi:hypothetical protein
MVHALPFVRFIGSGQNFQKCRFSGSVRPDQADFLAGPDLEGNAIQYGFLIELADNFID